MKKKWIALMITVMATCFAFAACDLSALLGGQTSEEASSVEQEYSSVEVSEEETSSSEVEEESSSMEEEETSELPEDSSESSQEDSLNGGRLEGDNDLVWGETQN